MDTFILARGGGLKEGSLRHGVLILVDRYFGSGVAQPTTFAIRALGTGVARTLRIAGIA